MKDIVNADGEIIGVGTDVLVTPVFIRTPYNYDMNKASDATGLLCPEPTLAQQHQAEDADINTLVKRFGLTGQMPIIDRVPIQDDFVGITSYQEAMNALIEAERVFMELPAATRKEFDNDPAKFLDFTSDEKNRAKMEEWGMVKPKAPEAEPIKVRVIPDQTPPPKADGVT